MSANKHGHKRIKIEKDKTKEEEGKWRKKIENEANKTKVEESKRKMRGKKIQRTR